MAGSMKETMALSLDLSFSQQAVDRAMRSESNRKKDHALINTHVHQTDLKRALKRALNSMWQTCPVAEID